MKSYLLMTTVATSMLLAACTGGDYKNLSTSFQNDFNQGKYEIASTNFVKATSKTEDGVETLGENTYLVGLQAGTSYLWANQPKESMKNFDYADAIATGKIKNESSYGPKYYETIMIQTYKSVASLADSNQTQANVMLNRANEMQNRALSKNQAQINDLMKKMNEAAAQIPDLKGINLNKTITQAQNDLNKNTQVVAATNYMNPYTSYVYGIYKAVDGDSKGADALKRVAAQAEKNTFVKDDAVAAKGAGSVWVVFENGLVGQIEAKSTKQNLIGEWGINVTAPTVVPSEAPKKSLTIKAGSKSVETQFIANMDNVVATELKNQQMLDIIKSITFELGKLGGVYKTCGGLKTPCTGLQQMVAVKAMEVPYPFDTRSWTSLPKEVQIARIDMPVNKTINISGIGDVKIPADAKFAMVTVRIPTTEATPSVVVSKIK